jgi:hypothetical protein
VGWLSVLVGVVLLLAAIRDKVGDVGEILAEDFQSGGGSPGFLAWIVVIVMLGIVGSWKPIRPVADAFMVLILVVVVIANRGFFPELMRQLNAPSGGKSAAASQ